MYGIRCSLFAARLLYFLHYFSPLHILTTYNRNTFCMNYNREITIILFSQTSQTYSSFQINRFSFFKLFVNYGEKWTQVIRLSIELGPLILLLIELNQDMLTTTLFAWSKIKYRQNISGFPWRVMTYEILIYLLDSR